jgi:hypothetical protein
MIVLVLSYLLIPYAWGFVVVLRLTGSMKEVANFCTYPDFTLSSLSPPNKPLAAPKPPRIRAVTPHNISTGIVVSFGTHTGLQCMYRPVYPS